MVWGCISGADVLGLHASLPPPAPLLPHTPSHPQVTLVEGMSDLLLLCLAVFPVAVMWAAMTVIIFGPSLEGMSDLQTALFTLMQVRVWGL